MPKYKNVNEGLLDRFISAIFTKVGKGLDSATINKLKKSDPKLAKQFQTLQDTKKEIEKTISKKDLKQLRRGELPDVFNM
tara:strand:- start:190 stop:429 length:240 start_codon:yes stop_codon:yes gene_type:complete